MSGLGGYRRVSADEYVPESVLQRPAYPCRDRRWWTTWLDDRSVGGDEGGIGRGAADTLGEYSTLEGLRVLDQEPYDHTKVRPPGGSISVAIGGPDSLRSSVWRIWGRPKTCDVYLAPRSVAGTLKTSLHESGQWQSSLTAQSAMKYVSRNQDRHFERWSRPGEPNLGPMTRAFYLLVPRTELRGHLDDAADAQVSADCGPLYWTLVEVYLVPADHEVTLRWEYGIETLGQIALPNGGRIWVTARPIRPKRHVADLMRRRREAILSALIERDEYVRRLEDGQSGHWTVMMHESFLDGTMGAIEMVLTEQPPSVRVICMCNDHARGHVERPSFLRDGF